MKVREIIEYLEKDAPTSLAYDWDNVGLLLGDAGMEVERVLVTLDVTRNAVEKAVKTGCQMIVSHHPLFLRPLKRINNPLILRLAKHGIAVYCAHTNLDMARGGVNDALAARLGLQDCRVLSHEGGSEWLQVAVYTPPEYVDTVAEAAHQAGAGVIGQYQRCSTRLNALGRFEPLQGASPYIGEVGRAEMVKEEKLEFFCDSTRINGILAAVKAAHPYETPAIAVYPQQQPDPNHGLGLIGDLPEPAPLREFALQVRQQLCAPSVKLWPASASHTDLVRTVAVCGGSGGPLIPRAKRAGADVFVLGESNYHGVLDATLPLVLAGHFYTEQPITPVLTERLRGLGLQAETLEASEHEFDRFETLT